MAKIKWTNDHKLIEKWATDPEDFCRSGLNFDARGIKISEQQLQAIKEIKKLVSAKLKAAAGEELTEKEAKYSNKTGISIQSGHGTGKDAFAAWMILWFLICFYNPKIPCTAPTGHQLRDILWSEIRKWYRGSIFKDPENNMDILTIQTEKVFLTEQEGKEWFAIGRTSNPKSSAEEQAETLAGFHEDYMMIVVDEASGIPEPVSNPLRPH